MNNEEEVKERTMHWVRSFVVGYQICPFANRVVKQGSLMLQVLQQTQLAVLLERVLEALACLDTNPDIETMLLIIPNLFVPNGFHDYLDFVDQAEDLMLQAGYEGIYQLATFHPEYCFADEDPQDVTHYTNRSPFPMIHVLREASLDEAIDYYGDTEKIPEKNIATLRELGLEKIRKIVQAL